MSALSALVSLGAALLGELVGPAGCCACDARVGTRTLFCPTCASSVERAAERGDTHVATFEYGGAMATAIARLKYQGRSDLAPRLGAAMIASGRAAGAVDVVVPVPLHPRRLVERGFNQAALLATPVARSLGVRFEPRRLARVHETQRQATLGREARLVNLEGVFRVRGRIEGARVLLVDDVRTTGATLHACTATLRRAGAASVVALVLAQRS